MGLILFVAAACGQTEEVFQPSYDPAECEFTPPRGQTVECGYLTVPEDRDGSDGTTIRLQVAVFKSASENPAPDPIVFLEGGPGGSAVLQRGRDSPGPQRSVFLIRL